MKRWCFGVLVLCCVSNSVYLFMESNLRESQWKEEQEIRWAILNLLNRYVATQEVEDDCCDHTTAARVVGIKNSTKINHKAQ